MTSKLSGVDILNGDTASCQAEQKPSTLLDEQIHLQPNPNPSTSTMSFLKITIMLVMKRGEVHLGGDLVSLCSV